MQFTQSERNLHSQHQFTPPCNYYNPAKEQSKIKTGSLYGPTVARQQPNFGLSSRFNVTQTNRPSKAPGPGSYFNQKVQGQLPKNMVKNGIVIRQYKRHGFLGSDQRSPSIPYSQLNFDEEDEQNIRQLELTQDLNKSALSLKRKTDGYTFSKSPRHFDKTNGPKPQQQVPLETIAEYAQKVRKMKMKPKINIRQQLQKTNQRRAEIINMINPEFTPSLELIEMITKRRTKFVPGPGFYNNGSAQDQNRIHQPGVAFPVSRRFSEEKESNMGPGRYVVTDEKKKSISFSKSSRNLFNLKSDTDLEHRFYIDPYSNIRRRQNVSTKGQEQPFSFGSQVVRFNKIQKQPVKITQPSQKTKRQSKIEAVVEMRLQKLQLHQKRHTKQSQGLLGISTMASSIE